VPAIKTTPTITNKIVEVGIINASSSLPTPEEQITVPC
jgi:hypothetical protein